MPFVSKAQRGWMWAHHPRMARRWQEHTPKGKDLPEHVKKAVDKVALSENLLRRAYSKVVTQPFEGRNIRRIHQLETALGKKIIQKQRAKIDAEIPGPFDWNKVKQREEEIARRATLPPRKKSTFERMNQLNDEAADAALRFPAGEPPVKVTARMALDSPFYGLDPTKELYKLGKDLIPGGKADDKPSSAFDPKQLAMGKKVEMEHTNDPRKAKEIATDHLEEFGTYYSALKKMEDQLAEGKTAAYHIGTHHAVLALVYG